MCSVEYCNEDIRQVWSLCSAKFKVGKGIY